MYRYWRTRVARPLRLGYGRVNKPSQQEASERPDLLEAEDEEAARAIMAADPAITSGLMTGELRPMRVTFLRGRD